MNLRIGDPVHKGSPKLRGVHIIRMKELPAGERELFAWYDGTRFAGGRPTFDEADAEQLDENGRVQKIRAIRREDVEYWRTVERENDRPQPVEDDEPMGWLAKLRASVARMLGRG